MLQDPTVWVAISFTIFVVMVFRKGKAMLMTTLDTRSERIRKELDDAQRLREDAQAVLAECQRRQAEAESEVEQILAYARGEADRIRARAEAEAKASVKRREQQALDRIAQAEAMVLAEVREAVIDVALNATRDVFAQQLARDGKDPLVDEGITSLGRLLN